MDAFQFAPTLAPSAPANPTAPANRPPREALAAQPQAAPASDRTTLSAPEAEVSQTPNFTALGRNFPRRGSEALDTAQQVAEAVTGNDPGRALAGMAGAAAGQLGGRIAGGALCAPIPPAVPACAFVGGMAGQHLGGLVGEAIYDNLPSGQNLRQSLESLHSHPHTYAL